MSLNKQNHVHPNLLGASVGVLIALPIASLLAYFFGNDYESRTTVYIVTLCWSIIGAICIFIFLKNTSKKLTLKALLIWTISIWLWPLLILSNLKKK